MNKFVLTIEKYIGAGFLNLLGSTIRFNRFTSAPNKPVIYMIWHRDQIALLLLHKHGNVGAMISKSTDGQLIAGPITLLGYKPIRGSSSKGGSSALRNLIKHLKTYSATITPDGPRGPRYSIKDGILTAAYLSKRPIVPVALDVSREWVFNSWDKFRVPKPFAKANVMYGNEIKVENKSDFSIYKNLLEDEMSRLENIVKIK